MPRTWTLPSSCHLHCPDSKGRRRTLGDRRRNKTTSSLITAASVLLTTRRRRFAENFSAACSTGVFPALGSTCSYHHDHWDRYYQVCQTGRELREKIEENKPGSAAPLSSHCWEEAGDPELRLLTRQHLKVTLPLREERWEFRQTKVGYRLPSPLCVHGDSHKTSAGGTNSTMSRPPRIPSHTCPLLIAACGMIQGVYLKTVPWTHGSLLSQTDSEGP